MEILYFVIEALIVFGLAAVFGGTMIGYYFTKKMEFEQAKASFVAKALQAAQQKKTQ